MPYGGDPRPTIRDRSNGVIMRLGNKQPIPYNLSATPIYSREQHTMSFSILLPILDNLGYVISAMLSAIQHQNQHGIRRIRISVA